SCWKTASVYGLRPGLIAAAARSTAEKEPLPNPSQRFPTESTLPAVSRIQSALDTARRRHHRQRSEGLSRSVQFPAPWQFRPSASPNPAVRRNLAFASGVAKTRLGRDPHHKAASQPRKACEPTNAL